MNEQLSFRDELRKQELERPWFYKQVLHQLSNLKEVNQSEIYQRDH